jgi:histidine triad (HIT) family protein
LDNCIFCKIVAKTIPSKVIYEDAELIAFHDIHPVAPIHFLIMPKMHIDNLAHCSDQHAVMLAKMLMLAPKLASEQGCGYAKEEGQAPTGGFRSVINTGPDSGQEVYHLHMHVLGGPRPWRD